MDQEAHSAPPPGRRGRPTAERAEKIDRTILQAALELFLERGFEGATIEGVAERAQVSKGTVYARFPGKDALFKKVIEHALQSWSARAGQFDSLMPDDTAGRLRFHADTLKRMFCSQEVQRFTRLMDQTADEFPDLAAFWIATGMHDYRDLIARDLAEAAGPGAGNRDWTFIADLFLHALSSWLRTEHLIRNVDEAQIRIHSEKLVDAVMGMISRQANTESPEGISK